MEKVTTETPVQEAKENEVEVKEFTASPFSLAQLYAMFRPIKESAWYILHTRSERRLFSGFWKLITRKRS